MSKMSKEEKQSKEITKAQPRALSPFEEMDRWMDAMTRGFFHPMRWEWPSWPEVQIQAPKVDVVDRDNEILIRAEVPGVKKEDLEVSMTDNTVTIKGSTSHEEKEEKGDYYRHEISKGSFSRTVALPGDVDSDKCQTSFKDGVLELTVPKVEKAKRRTIKVE
jgi:HSP20 family protein